MALACTATSFAAVTYGEDNQLTVAYTADGNKLAVTSGWNADDAQVTLLVVKGDNPSTISDGDILYIDQQAKDAAATAFASVGLLGETALAEGTYTVKAGGSAGNVYTSTFTIAADAPVVEYLDFVWGDVTNDSASDIKDAGAILLSALEGGDKQPGGTPYEIGASVALKDVTFTWGDVTNDAASDIKDAGAILLSALEGGDKQPGGTPYEIGASVSLAK